MGAFVRAVDRVVVVVAALLVVVLLGCVMLGVLSRAAGAPFIWTDEASRFVMVWLAAFGWMAASRRQIHVRIRYFQQKLPPRAHRAVEVAIQLAMALFGALVLVYATLLVMRNHDLEATTLPIAIAWMYVPLIGAGAMTLAQGLAEAIGALRTPRESNATGVAP